MRASLCFAVSVFVWSAWLGGGAAAAQTFPDGFVDAEVLAGLSEPATLAFAPDGRLFVGERITGRLLIAERSPATGETWQLLPEPFYVFDIPKNPDGSPARHRSSGLRDIAFDPAFAANGRLYAFFMNDNPRHNRVVRVTASAADANVGDPASETLLIDLPFNSSSSSGSHNGGGIEFGGDGLLYVTTGDGWTGGDPVQSLETFTGKVLRIDTDGSIPIDNPHYGETTGDYRAIYARGLRNPFSLSRDAAGRLFVNDARGTAKADIFLLAAGANYGHQGGDPPVTGPWANAAAAGELITGGAWYPAGGPFPVDYHGAYFVALWGSNGSSSDGAVGRIRSFADPTAEVFATQVHDGNRKPILTRIDPLTGDLFYALTTYETELGSVHRLRWQGTASAAAPTFAPPGGQYDNPVAVTLTSTTPDATVHYTTDGGEPTDSSPVAVAPVPVNETLTLRARAFAPDLLPSAVRSEEYVIGPVPNDPPVALAGVDQQVELGLPVTLDGSASFDPDGDDLELIEQWVQTAGEMLPFVGDDFVAFLDPPPLGTYEFELQVSDGVDSSSDRVTVDVLPCVEDVVDGLVAAWDLDQGAGPWALDSAGAQLGTLVGATWQATTPDGSPSALEFDGVDDRVDLGPVDVSGDQMTLSLWLRADDFDQMDGRLISKAVGVQEPEHTWMLSTIAAGGGHRLRARLRTGGSTSTLIADSGPLSTGSWHHAAMIYDGAQLHLFLDAVEVGSMPLVGAISTAPSVPVSLGDQPQGGRAFDGGLDAVRLYGRVLTVEELEQLAGQRQRCGGVFADGFETGDVSSWTSSSP